MKTNKRNILLFALLIAFLGSGGFLLGKKMNWWGNQKETNQAQLYHCPMHPTYTSDRPGDCPICGMKLVKVETEEHEMSEGHESMTSMNHDPNTPAEPTPKSHCLVHNCPMLKEGKVCPMLILDKDGKPGVCPICGQKLTGKEAEAIDQPRDIMDYTAVTLSPERQQLIGIRTAPVVSQTSSKTIRTVGKIAYDPELYQAEQEYLEAISAHEKAKSGAPGEIIERSQALVNSTKTKLELLGLSDDLIREVRRSGVPDRSLILAKRGGKVWMYAPIYEQELDVVKPGQSVEVTAQNIMAGKIFKGTVRSIDPVLDPKTRSVRIRAVLDNSEGLLKPNVYVNAEIKIPLGEQLLIPESAVLDSGERKIAFVALGKGVFEPRLLTLGPKLEDSFVVVDGVAKDEKVVVQAAFFVDSESRLKAALGQMGSNPHAGHGGQ